MHHAGENQQPGTARWEEWRFVPQVDELMDSRCAGWEGWWGDQQQVWRQQPKPAVENAARKHKYGRGRINTDSRRVGVGAMPLTSNGKLAEKRLCFFCVNAAFLLLPLLLLPVLMLLLLLWLAARAVRCAALFFWPHKSACAAKCAERITGCRGTPWQQDTYS